MDQGGLAALVARNKSRRDVDAFPEVVRLSPWT